MLFIYFWIIVAGMSLAVLPEVISLYDSETYIIIYPVLILIFYFLRSVCCFFPFELFYSVYVTGCFTRSDIFVWFQMISILYTILRVRNLEAFLSFVTALQWWCCRSHPWPLVCQGNEVCPPFIQIREISERKNGKKTRWYEWASIRCRFSIVVAAVVYYTRLARVARGRNSSFWR